MKTMPTTNVTIAGVKMPIGAAGSVEECGVDVAADLARVRAGLSAADLLAECLDGVEPDDRVRRADWQDYVTAIEIAAARDEFHCECGQWSGERCQWSGPKSETVEIAFMPNDLRSSHRAAGNHGIYPANGALVITVERTCADRMVESDREWVEVQ